MVETATFVDPNPQPVTNASRALQRMWANRMKGLKAQRRAQAQYGASTRAIDAEIRTLRCCIYQVQILQQAYTKHMKEVDAAYHFYADEFDMRVPARAFDIADGEFRELS